MFLNLFKKKFKIMPVYAEDETKQTGVVVMVKDGVFGYWEPAEKNYLDKKGDLTHQLAIFDDEKSAQYFIERMTTIL